MPIVGFFCGNCGNEYETLYLSQRERDAEEADTTCPKCGSKDKKPAPPSGTSFQLKGSGWAKDNYGGGRKKRR